MLEINQSYINSYTHSVKNAHKEYKPTSKDTVNFTGRVGHEVFKNGKKNIVLIQETAFFREPKTLAYSVNYVKKHLYTEPKIKILVGACSSGEEALSYKMLTGKKAEVLGFDLGKNVIKQANENVYQISVPKDSKNAKYAKDIGLSAYKDFYLGFESRSLTSEQKRYKKLFNHFFEKIQTPEHKTKLIDKVRNFLLEKLGQTPDIQVESKTYKLKNPDKLNCKFIVGDINNLDTFTSKGNAHILSFRNAFYHIMNDGLDQYARVPKTKTKLEPILDNIGKQANKVLKKDGLFVLGEHEEAQGSDMDLLSAVLQKNGFAKVVDRGDEYCNIWRKVKDIT